MSCEFRDGMGRCLFNRIDCLNPQKCGAVQARDGVRGLLAEAREEAVGALLAQARKEAVREFVEHVLPGGEAWPEGFEVDDLRDQANEHERLSYIAGLGWFAQYRGDDLNAKGLPAAAEAAALLAEGEKGGDR